MSRAFVKEDGDAPEPAPLERPISSAPNRVTPRGFKLIEEEIARLEAEIGEAEDEAAIAPLKRDLNYWSARSASAQLVEPDPAPEAAGFGTRITIRRGGETSEIIIVGEDEADPAQGLIAWTSPLAQALEEAEPGETVEMEAGGRSEPIEVLAVAAGTAIDIQQ
jgi:transcription elongation GreA/GreB family factor